MELTNLFIGKTVFFDTAPIIYFIEKNNRYHSLVKPIISMLDSEQARGITSTITLLEVLLHPLRGGKKELADKYKSILLASNGLTTCEISHEISEYAALLRAQHGLKTPDAIQLSTSLINKSDFFLTNDPSFKRAAQVTVIIPDDHLEGGKIIRR